MKILGYLHLRDLLGFTRRERRASFILLLIILAVAGIRFIVPEKNTIITETWYDESEQVIENEPVMVKVLSTGGSIYSTGTQSKRRIVDINKCDSTDLEALPGIGPVLSARIIKYRNLLGGFASVSQLKEVYGLPEETFNLISGMVKADSSTVKKININQADYKQIKKLPYFTGYEVTAILKYRDLEGKIENISELIDNKIITQEKAKMVRAYLVYE